MVKARLLDRSSSGLRTLVAVFETGDRVMAGLKELAAKERPTAAQLSAIGACSKVELAYFDWDEKEYRSIPVDEQVEVASMLGDIGVDGEGAPPCTSIWCSGGATVRRSQATCARPRFGRRLRS